MSRASLISDSKRREVLRVCSIMQSGKQDYAIDRVYAAVEPEDKLTTGAWCNLFGATKANSIEEVVEESDGIIIFSPDHPEQHEMLAEKPLCSGKPVFIDKTFASDWAAAKRMSQKATQHGTPLFSSSSLRFSRELMDIRGRGGNRERLTVGAFPR